MYNQLNITQKQLTTKEDVTHSRFS